MELIKILYQLKKNIADRRSDVKFSAMLDRFESLIDANPDLEDEDAVLSLYGKKKVHMAYRALKYRMEERLMNDLIRYSSEEKNTTSRVYMGLVPDKYLLVATLLMKNFQRKAAIPIYEKSYKLAVKYSYTSQELAIARVLSNHYGYVDADQKKMMFYLDRSKKASATLDAETFVSQCYVIVSNMYYTTKGAFSKRQVAEMKQMVSRLVEIKKKYRSNYIILHTNDLINYYYQTTGDYTSALKYAYESLDEINALGKEEAFGLYQSKLNVGISHFYLHQYEEAQKWLLETEKMITQGTRNWFHVTSLMYLNLMSARRLEDLKSLTLKVTTNSNLKKFQYYQEQWNLREAFFHILIKTGNILPTLEEENSIRPFSLSRFLNSMPLHSRDKSGQNITILILQVIFLLIEKKYSQIIDRMDALSQYTYRYLRNDNSFRSNCFIKMLILMVKADFHPVRTKTLTASLYKRLLGSQIITDEKSSQVEIMSYDFLWDIILELLEKLHAGSSSK